MTVTVTGNKYSGALTSAGTTTLTNSGASFSSGDFNVPRLVGLWNSAGTTFKGFAYVRRYVSGTQLELVKGFIDRDGATVTQVVGDTYQVSKNFADIATTGIAVSNNSVTISDNVIWGTGGTNNSLCFYDESKSITVTSAATATSVPFFRFAGGLAVFGFLEDFATRKTRSGCAIYSQNVVSNPNGTGGIACSATTAKALFFGCQIQADQSPHYIGDWLNGSFATQGSAGELFWFWNLVTNCDILSTPVGGSWASNAAYHQIINPAIAANGTNAILLRWGDGAVEGGSYTLVGSAGISVLGADAAGTYNFGAPAGSFFVVNDCGTTTNQALWRQGAAATQTVNLTNVVTPNRKFGTTTTPGVNPSSVTTGIFKFSGKYTGLVNGTLGLVRQNSTGSSVVDSGTAASNQLTLTVQEASVVGHTETVTETAWVYGFYLYGYSLVAGSFSTATTTVNGGQSAKQVSFGSFIGQVLDTNITQTTAATVAAYTAIDNLDKLYDYAQYFKALNTGNATYPTYNTQLITNTGGTLATTQNLTIDSGASLFAVNTGTGTITIKASALAIGTKSDTLQMSAGKTLTFAQNGDKSAVAYLIPATTTVVVASGATNLQRSVGNGSTINVSSGTATVTVDNTSQWVAGTNVTLVQPAIAVSAPNFAQGTRVQVSHRQIFTVANTAINTTTNAITLGTDSNGNSPTFSTTTPNTLIRFSVNSGGTIPASSPQIIDGGLYYLKTNSSGVITISITEGGTAIDFTTQGSGTFTLTAETEKDNSLAGISGYSYNASLPNGALTRVKARYWQNSSGCTASAFFDSIYAWSTTAGISIPDTVSVAAYPDSIHNRIISISTIELPVSGTQTPTNDGSTVAGLTIALEGTGKVQINSNDADGVLLIQDIYCWGVYISSTQAGIRLASSTSFVATDLFNYQIMNMEFDNTGSIPLRIIGGRVTDQNGTTPIASTTSASIFPNVEQFGTGAIVNGSDPTTIATTVFSTTVETGYSFMNVVRLMASILGGRRNNSVAGSTVTTAYRDLNNTKDRLTGTLSTTDGDRTITTIDLS